MASNGQYKYLDYKGLQTFAKLISDKFTDTNSKFLPLTGGALTGPLVFNGSDTDRNVIRVNCTNGDATKIGEWGYTLKFLGSGSGIDNALALYADNSEATTQNLATKWLNDGTMYGRSILPHTTNTFDLGSSSLKWNKVYAASFEGNATISTKTGDGTNVLYVEKQNEINFGGSSSSDTIYFGYRAVDSKAIPSKFVFGSTTGTANITAAGFIKKGSSSNYFLLGNGDHILRSNYATIEKIIGKDGEIINGLTSKDYASKYASGSIGLDNQNIRVQIYEYASNDWVLKFDSNTVDTASAAALLKGQMLTIYSGTRGSKSKIVISECDNYIRDFYFHIKTLDSTFSTSGVTAKYEGYDASDNLAYTTSSDIATWGSWHVAPNNEQNLKRAIIYLNEELANSAIVIQGYRVYQTNPGINVLPGKSQSSFETDKLSTTKTLWGQSFNGTTNVSGDMSGVGSISMSKALTINGTDSNTANLHFGRTSYNYISSPTGSVIHMCPGGVSKSSTTGYIFGASEFYPGTTNAYSLGTTSLQWNNICGKTLYENGTSLANKYAASSHTHSYLPLTGGTLSAEKTTILSLNNTSSTTNHETGIKFALNGTSKGWVGYTNDVGTYLYNYTGHKLGIKDDGTGFINGKTIIHSGNYTTYAAAASHTHSYLTGAGAQSTATTRNLTDFPTSQTLFTGRWTSAGGYATNYGTTLDISYNTWYQRLAFNTTGRIEYFRGISTNNSDNTSATLTKVGDLAYVSDIPTESTVSGWGFTKNTGTYSKPSGGIPKTDLASAVQTSLGKADNAVTGPSSSTTNSIAVFDGTTGKVIKDSGLIHSKSGGVHTISTNIDNEEDLNIDAYDTIQLTPYNYSSSLKVSESIRIESFSSNLEVSDSITINAEDQVNIIGNSKVNITGNDGIELKNTTTITGECYATAFYETSDENLKDFSGDVDVDFAKLKEIRKSYFTWKDGETGKTQIGTSAQDVQKVYPELVSEDNKGNLTVDYAKLSIIALSAIDKLDERLSKIEKVLNITE